MDILTKLSPDQFMIALGFIALIVIAAPSAIKAYFGKHKKNGIIDTVYCDTSKCPLNSERWIILTDKLDDHLKWDPKPGHKEISDEHQKLNDNMEEIRDMVRKIISEDPRKFQEIANILKGMLTSSESLYGAIDKLTK